MNYYIEGCSMPFHDLPELFEFVRSSGRLLYMFQFLTVYLGSYPCFWIIIKYNPVTNRNYITYQDYPH